MTTEHSIEIESDHSDTEDPKQYARLLSAISRLDYKQRVKPPSRKEPSIQVSEFHLAKKQSSKKKNAVSIKDLASVLQKGTKSQTVISRKVQVAEEKSKTLAKPLEKLHAERVKRSAGFEKTKDVLARWDPVVESNRVADTLRFPLKTSLVKVHETNIFGSAMAPKTDLEKAMHEVLKDSGYIQEQEDKVEDAFPLTLNEVLAQRRETAKLKQRVARQQIKTWQQNKIKSKKFHRILRRERLRQQIKEFETLKETDPEEALKKLDQLERSRAQERASLRHRNTGAWAKSKAIRAKYDRESRQVLAQQLAISRDLTHKLQPVKDSSDSDTDGEEEVPNLVPMSGNTNENQQNDVNNFVSNYRKYWEQKNEGLIDTKPNILSSEVVSKGSNLSLLNSEKDTFLEENDNKKQTKVSKNKINKKAIDPVSITKKANKKKRNSLKVQSVSGNWIATETDVKTEEQQSDITEVSIGKKKTKKTNKRKITPTNDSSNSTEVSDEMKVLTGKKKRTKKANKVKIAPTSDSNTTEVTVEMKTVTGGKKKAKKVNKGNKAKIALTNGTSTEKKDNGAEIIDLFTEVENKQVKLVSKSIGKLKEFVDSINGGDNVSKPKKKKKTNESSAHTGKLQVNGKKKPKMRKLDSIPAAVVSLRPIVGEVQQISFPLNEGPEDEIASQQKEIERLSNVAEVGNVSSVTDGKKQIGAQDNIDPTKFLSAKPLKSRRSELVSTGIEDLDDIDEEEAERNRVDIAEAFAEDDVVDEFRQEKKDLEEASKPKEVDLTLPGWGEWGGSGISVSRRKRKRFILKPTEEAPRKDRDKRNVIIYEGKDSGLMKHQVSSLPYPFNRVQDFEASVRAPIGSTWVPETAHRKLTAPRVVVPLGQIVAPMTEEVLSKTEA